MPVGVTGKTLFTGKINSGTVLAFKLGVSKLRQEDIVISSVELKAEKDCARGVRQQLPILSSERTRHKKKTAV
jgi:hypothetical protein